MSKTLRSSLVAAAVILTASGSLRAQAAATDSRWEPWYGCWKPAAPSLAPAASVVCVEPLAANSVEITTIRSDTVVSHDTVVADGVHHSIEKQGCTGWQRATWSDDARRVYLHSDLNCGKDLGRTTDGMLAFAPNGDWLDIQALQAFGSSAVRVVRYQEDVQSTLPPAALSAAAAARDRQLRLNTQRMALGAKIDNKEIIDVAHHVDTAVVAAWVSARGQPMQVDAKELVALANAGVPGSVTDVMVAMAYPKELSIDQAPPEIGTAADSSRIAAAYMRSRFADSFGFWPYGWGPSYGFGYGYGYGMYGLYGYCPGFSTLGYSSLYSPYAYGAGCNPYSYGAYQGFGYPGYYGYGYVYPGYIGGVITGPVTVTPHGVPVKGHGYTRPGTGGAAVPTGYSGGSNGPQRATVGHEGYSGGSSSSGSSGGTAHPSGGSSGSGSGSGSGGGSAHATGGTAHSGKP